MRREKRNNRCEYRFRDFSKFFISFIHSNYPLSHNARHPKRLSPRNTNPWSPSSFTAKFGRKSSVAAIPSSSTSTVRIHELALATTRPLQCQDDVKRLTKPFMVDHEPQPVLDFPSSIVQLPELSTPLMIRLQLDNDDEQPAMPSTDVKEHKQTLAGSFSSPLSRARIPELSLLDTNDARLPFTSVNECTRIFRLTIVESSCSRALPSPYTST
jgi:hypothetical protein